MTGSPLLQKCKAGWKSQGQGRRCHLPAPGVTCEALAQRQGSGLSIN